MAVQTYVIVTMIIFAVMGFMHLVRIIEGWPARLGTMTVPIWASVIAVPALAAIILWGLSFLTYR